MSLENNGPSPESFTEEGERLTFARVEKEGKGAKEASPAELRAALDVSLCQTIEIARELTGKIAPHHAEILAGLPEGWQGEDYPLYDMIRGKRVMF